MSNLFNYPLYVIVTLCALNVQWISSAETENSNVKNSSKNDRLNKNNYWIEGKSFGPIKYSFEHKEGKFDRLKTKNVYSGNVLIYEIGFTFKLSDIEQLEECNASLISNKYDCKTLENYFIDSGRELPKLNNDIVQTLSPIEYYKIKKTKLRLKIKPPGLREVLLPNGIAIEIYQYPLRAEPTVREEKIQLIANESMSHQYWEIQLVQPHNLICSGVIRQSHDLISNILNNLQNFNSLARFFESITQTKNYTISIDNLSCKLADSPNNNSNVSQKVDNVENLNTQFQLVQSLNITWQDRCPRWKLDHSIHMLPSKEALEYYGSIKEHCDDLPSGIVNTTISMNLTSVAFPLIDLKLAQSFIHNTTSKEGWESMTMTNPLVKAYVNANWSSESYFKTLIVMPGQTLSQSNNKLESGLDNINLNGLSLNAPSLLEARYGTNDSSEYIDFGLRLNKNYLGQLFQLLSIENKSEDPYDADDETVGQMSVRSDL